jgi:hypothetical protein
MPLFRGIIFLVGKEPPTKKSDVMALLSVSTGVNTDIFKKIIDIKKGKIRPAKDELNTVFEEYYSATEKIGTFVDELKI